MTPASIATAKLKGGRGRDDILETDRNGLQNYLIASGSNLVLMNTEPEKSSAPPDSKRGRIITLGDSCAIYFQNSATNLGGLFRGSKSKVLKASKQRKSNPATTTTSMLD